MARAIGSPATMARRQNPSRITVSVLPDRPASVIQPARSARPVRLTRPLPAFRVAAAGALVAVLDAHQRRLAAFRALPQQRPSEAEAVSRRALGAERDDLGIEDALAVRVLWR